MSLALDWYSVTFGALQNLWQVFLSFIPKIIGAVVVFVIGWFIAAGIAKLVSEILRRVKFNQLFEKTGWKDALEKADWKVDPSGFIGAIFKWIFVIVFLFAAVEILGFVQFAEFLQGVVSWLPNVVVAVAIFIVAVIIADILEKVTRATVEKIGIGYARLIAGIVKWAIWVFAVLAILIQLGIAKELIVTLFTGCVAFLVISGGIAFGLGGKDAAAEILRDVRGRLKR